MVTIRRMQKDDFEKLADVFIHEWSEPPYNEKWPRKRALRRFEELFRDLHYCLVVLDGEVIIGYASAYRFTWFDGDYLFIDDIVISREHQGKGIGSKLIANLEEACRKENISGIHIHAHLDSKAIGFYRRHGFKKSRWMLLTRNL